MSDLIVSPATGEALTLDAPTAVLARFLADVRHFEGQLKDTKRVVSDEVLRRMDERCVWTEHVEGGLKLSAPSSAPQESWDGAELRERLLALVDEGLLAPEAVDAAVETVVSYEPRKAGINALRKRGGRVREVVDSLCVVREKARYITVSRST